MSEEELCEECGKPMSIHIFKEGARFHVLSWSTTGTHCSEPTCKINHEKCKD